jgi:hypothetical protein
VFAEAARIRRFRLTTDDDGPYTVLRVDLELPESYNPDGEAAGIAEHYSAAVLKKLLDANFDFADAYSIHADAMVPRVALHAQGTGPFEQQAGSFKPKSLA